MLPRCGGYFDHGTEWRWANQLTSLTTDGSPRMHTACCSSMLPFFIFASVIDLGANFLKKRSRCALVGRAGALSCYGIYNKPILRPATTYDVTLTHFYRALGRDLGQWELWGDFVNDFPAKLFRLSGVNRNSLRKNPELLEQFFQWICFVRSESAAYSRTRRWVWLTFWIVRPRLGSAKQPRPRELQGWQTIPTGKNWKKKLRRLSQNLL